MVASKMCGSCGQPPSTVRMSSDAKPARSCPFSAAVPADRSQNRSSTAATVDFPAPGRPDQRDPPSRRQVQVDPVDRRRPVAGVADLRAAQRDHVRPAGSGRGSAGSLTGSAASSTSAIRLALARDWPSWIAAAGSPVTASNAASAVSVTTASGTLVSAPEPTAATPASSTSHRVSPAVAAVSPVPRPAAAAERRASLVSSSSASAARSSAASMAPNACRSAAPASRSVTAVPSSPRGGAVRSAAWRAPRAASHGTAAPASSSPPPSTRPAGASSSRHAPVAPAPTRAAVSGGAIPRMNRSWVASTSETSRASRSPDRKAARPAGASRASRR